MNTSRALDSDVTQEITSDAMRELQLYLQLRAGGCNLVHLYNSRYNKKKTTVALQVFTKAQLCLKPQLMYLVSSDVVAEVGKRGPSWEATKRHQIERL